MAAAADLDDEFNLLDDIFDELDSELLIKLEGERPAATTTTIKEQSHSKPNISHDTYKVPQTFCEPPRASPKPNGPVSDEALLDGIEWSDDEGDESIVASKPIKHVNHEVAALRIQRKRADYVGSPSSADPEPQGLPHIDSTLL
jgi:hypothetical protein